MDTFDRLWEQLVFPWCACPQALLRLRAVCRGFRHLLNESRLWLPWTAELSRLCHDERVDGWRGVSRAILRENNTRANCDMAHCVRGPLLEIDGWRAVFVAGRVAAFHSAGITLLDPGTGAVLGSFVLDRPELGLRSTGNNVVLDRWIPFGVAGGRGLVLDCVAAQVWDFAPLDRAWGYEFRFSVAGSCLSWRRRGRTQVTVVRLDGSHAGATVMWQVARMQMAHLQIQFGLCDHGRSCLLFDQRQRTLQLVELTTGVPLRVFIPRTIFWFRSLSLSLSILHVAFF